MAFEFSLGGDEMYPLQRNDELADHHLQIPYIPNRQPDKSQQDLITLIRTGHPPEKRRLSHKNIIDGPYNHEYKLKRIMHRDIERQRRQEMAKLYASLRSLLPLEYIKGKRSISDHMHEAVNYIKYLERSITELGILKDKLITNKPNYDSAVSGNANIARAETATFSPNSFTVTVNPCPPDGLEILIGSNLKDNGEVLFPLSKVLKKLINHGLNVVSCISTNVNQRLVYKIQTEVSDPKCIDKMAQLQQNLTNVLSADSID